MAEIKPITINNFQQGINPNVFAGHSVMSGLDTSTLGTMTAKNAMTVSASPFDAGLAPVWTTTDGSETFYFCRGFSSTYSAFYRGSTKKTSYTGGSSYDPLGMAYYNSKVYLAYGNAVAEYNIAADTMDMNKFSLASSGPAGIFAPMLVGSDDILYIGYRQYIASYNGTTFTQIKCTLPNNRQVVCMVEYGNNILIATYGGKKTIIYSWNRQSNLADVWAIIEDTPVRSMLVHNNIVYIITGFKLTLWKSVGTQVEKMFTVTDYQRSTIRPNDDINISSYYSGVAAYGIQSFTAFGSKLYFSVPSYQNNGIYPAGIWSYDTSSGVKKQEFNFYDYSNKSAAFGDGRNVTLIQTVTATSISYYELDLISSTYTTRGISVSFGLNTVQNSTYNQFYESPIYQVGTTNNKKTFNTLTVELSDSILSNEGIQISYRTQMTGSWTVLGELNTAGQLSKEFPFAVTCEFLQIKAEFKSSSTVYNDSAVYVGYPYPMLQSIIIK